MWMNSRFAQWEVEGQVRERVNNALREAEHGQLLRTARGAKSGLTLGGLVNSVKANLRSFDLLAGRLQLQEPTS